MKSIFLVMLDEQYMELGLCLTHNLVETDKLLLCTKFKKKNICRQATFGVSM
jgi:hypothetical protein